MCTGNAAPHPRLLAGEAARRGGDPPSDSGSDGGDAGDAREEGAPPLEWPQCMDDLGSSNRVCSEALERVVRACPGSAQLLWGGERSSGHVSRDSFLPFLP